jgi:hypothetical protein
VFRRVLIVILGLLVLGAAVLALLFAHYKANEHTRFAQAHGNEAAPGPQREIVVSRALQTVEPSA